MLLKGMGERFLPSEDEPLTPNIDGVMALWIFRRRAQNTKIGQKSAKIGPLDPSTNLKLKPCIDVASVGAGSRSIERFWWAGEGGG